MRGFTLIEVLIYMTISSFILTTLMSFAFNMIETQAKTRDIVDQQLEELYVLRTQ